MSKNLYIDASHPNETRVVLKNNNHIEDYEYESINNTLIKNNIYLGKVSRIEPSLQAAFVDFGRERHGFLSFNDIQSDYYQLPLSDLEKIKEEEEKVREELSKESQAKINDLILKAPFDGILGTKNFSEGAFLVPGDVVVSIYDIKQIKVKINIPERYSNNLKIGQKFEAIIPSNKKEKLVGNIFAIDPLIDKSTRTFIVLGIIKNDKNRSFKPGMMVNVGIILESNNQLSIPEGCIIPEDDETFIYVVNSENIVIKKKIEIGKRKDGLVEVLDGLSTDENVIFEGTNKVRNGIKVVINK